MRMSHKTDWVPQELTVYRDIIRRLISEGYDADRASRVARVMVERYGSNQRRVVSRNREAVR